MKVNSDKTLTKQKERIRQLNDRITLINKALTQTTGSPAKIPKAPIINSSSTRKGSTFSSPSKRTVSASATSSPIKMAELRSGESSLNTTTQDIDNDLEMDKEEFVPVALYEALEKSVLKLSSSVNAKDNSLAEKDEVIEVNFSFFAVYSFFFRYLKRNLKFCKRHVLLMLKFQRRKNWI